MRLYSMQEKKAHVEHAKAYVMEGKGTYSSYAREAGVPRTTFHKWLHDLLPDGVKKPRTQNPENGIIKLGKPMTHDAGSGKFMVDYYGSRIEVGTTQDLVELLKGIRKASAT